MSGWTAHSLAQEHLSKKEIRAAQIDSIFSRAEAGSLDTRGILRYEYFFKTADDVQLEKFSKKLEKDSFETILLEMDEDKLWRMVIMKNEIHSRQTMFEEDKRMRAMTYQYVVDHYDGFTISKVKVNPLKVPNDKFVSFIKSLDNEDLFDAADYLIRNKAYDRSMVAFQESINRHFKEDTAQYQMGNALVATNEFVKGIERWEAARNMNRKYLDAYLKLGDIFLENSHFNRSLYNYQEADTIKPNDDVILYKIAANLLQLKRYNESYDYAQRAYDINRKNVFVKGLLEILDQPAIRKIRKKNSDQ